MTPLKFKVILDIKFKCLIHKCDTGDRKNAFKNCHTGYKKLALPFLINGNR